MTTPDCTRSGKCRSAACARICSVHNWVSSVFKSSGIPRPSSKAHGRGRSGRRTPATDLPRRLPSLWQARAHARGRKQARCGRLKKKVGPRLRKLPALVIEYVRARQASRDPSPAFQVETTSRRGGRRGAQLPFAVRRGSAPMETTFAGAAGRCGRETREYFGVSPGRLLSLRDGASSAVQKMAPTNLMPLFGQVRRRGMPTRSTYYNTSTWARGVRRRDRRARGGVRTAVRSRLHREPSSKKGQEPGKARREFATRLVGPPAVRGGRGRKVVVWRLRPVKTTRARLRPDKFIDAALDGIEAAPQLVALTRTRLPYFRQRRFVIQWAGEPKSRGFTLERAR